MWHEYFNQARALGPTFKKMRQFNEMGNSASTKTASGRSPDGRITTERRGHIYIIGIDRPEKYNAFTPKMFDELSAAYNELERNDDLWIGVLFAHGPHFTAGLDLPKFADRFQAGADLRPATGIDPFGLTGPALTKPVVTAVQGITFTAGIELMLATDIVVASSDCRFSQLEVKRGLVAMGGATFRFVERGGWGNAMKHLLTGDEFDCAEALRIGLIQEAVPPGQQVDRAIELAEKIAAQAPLAVKETMASARLAKAEGPAAAIREFKAVQTRLARTEDFTEGLNSLIEKRPGNFRGR
jgi:enoyl-CoA hydratase/carnithine racemase